MRFFRLVLLVFLILTAIVAVNGVRALVNEGANANIFATVYNGADAYIMSFTAGIPRPNLIYSATSLPNGFMPRYFSISQDGRTIFANAPRANSSRIDIVYSHSGQPFAPLPVESYGGFLSQDGKTLFYISIDPSGRNQSFNFLTLATGQRAQLLAVSLPNPAQPSLNNFLQFSVPVSGWSLYQKHLFFTSYTRTPLPDFVRSGFYWINTSSIDFAQPSGNRLLERHEIPSAARRISEGYVSPDGKKLAYMFVPDDAEDTNRDAPWSKVAIYDLGSDTTITINLADGALVSNIAWRDDSNSLIYMVPHSDRDTFQVWSFEYANKQSKRLPINISGGLPYARNLNMALCGNALFYSIRPSIPGSYIQFDTLYSASLDPPAASTALFSADSIEISSCAPPYAWNIATTEGTCSPFCTPAPKIVIGQDVDITQLSLTGGDAVNGDKLYVTLGCAGCHLAGQVAPITARTYTRVVNERLKDPMNAGKTVEQYLAESVLRPTAFIVPNFPDIQPRDYGTKMSVQDLRDVIAYMMTLK